ncbi:MAG: radical SAM protein [Patescibacteria group bacterium]|nr:radical SAM protein [Patescibacteria group bacterium]
METIGGHNINNTASRMSLQAKAESSVVTKYVWATRDGHTVESAHLQFRTREYDSLCISSQIGCAMKCAFCATGLQGIVRNLTGDEIILQVNGMLGDTQYPARGLEVSFTGMGEPLLNFSAVKSALEHISPDMRVVISTVGIAPGIRKLVGLRMTNLQLRVSLHAPNDELRTELMPITRQYPIGEVLAAAVEYADTLRTRVVLNYVLLKDVNDAEAHAEELVGLLNGLPVRLRLSRFSPVSETGFAESANHHAFEQICAQGGLDVYQFHSLGTEIGAGMGQFRHYRPEAPAPWASRVTRNADLVAV